MTSRLTGLTEHIQKPDSPLFGLKMADVTGQPVLYGLGAEQFETFAVKTRHPSGLDGRYDNDQEPFVATVIDGIGMMPCLKYNQDNECADTDHLFRIKRSVKSPPSISSNI